MHPCGGRRAGGGRGVEREGGEAPLQPEEDQGRKGTPSSKQARRGEAEEQEGGESKQKREAASKGEEKGNPQAPNTEEDPPGPGPGTQAEQQSPREPPNQSSQPQGGNQPTCIYDNRREAGGGGPKAGGRGRRAGRIFASLQCHSYGSCLPLSGAREHISKAGSMPKPQYR